MPLAGSIRNVTSGYYFIRAGNIMQQNDVTIGVKGTNVVDVTIPFPSGNVTLTQSSPSSGVEILYETYTPE